MAVRLHAEWMSQGDDRLLEILDVDGPLSPSQIAADDRIRLARAHLNMRLKQLTTAGLVENIANGVYQLTDEGEAYLQGELDARDLSEP